MSEHTFAARPVALETEPKPTRRRQWHHKTRAGCDTCKLRRVKCSEERPVCRKCLVGARQCTYSEPSSARLVKVPLSNTSRMRPTVDIASPEGCYEKRAIQFFNEQTAPTMQTFTSYTKHFWSLLVPQVASSEPSIRHITIAMASRQEKKLAATTSEVARLQHMESKHFASSLSSLPNGQTVGEMEVILLASALFVGYGNFQDVEHQSAQHMQHLCSALRILHERADNSRPTATSDIIDETLQPMFARLGFLLSVFMAPRGVNEYSIALEPVEPVLPSKFEDILQVRRYFLHICCYRYHHAFRERPWTCLAPGFLAVRQMLLDWHNLLLAYQGGLNAHSVAEHQRITVMLSQFRLIFVAFIYSGRTDLHMNADHPRPSHVEVVDKEKVSIAYDLPGRYLRLLPALDWESVPLRDPLQVRLWPVADIIDRSEHSVRMSLSFQL